MINLISGGLSIAAVTLTVLLVDKIGCKPILLYGSIGMALTLTLVTYTFASATTAADGSVTLEGGLAQWGSNFAITMTFPIMLTNIGLAGAYGFYTLCAFLSIVFVLKMVHETRGIELEDMQG